MLLIQYKRVGGSVGGIGLWWWLLLVLAEVSYVRDVKYA